jgi:hypothetical protein
VHLSLVWHPRLLNHDKSKIFGCPLAAETRNQVSFPRSISTNVVFSDGSSATGDIVINPAGNIVSPEPGTTTMLGGGLMIAGWATRKRIAK